MKLLVDYRERHLADLLEGACEEIAFVHLPLGDYFLTSDLNALMVERKTTKDFFSSIRSNRLWDQLLRMMKAEQVLEYSVTRRILLVHGSFEDYFQSVDYGCLNDLLKHWSQLMGAYLEIIYVYNTPIVYAESDVAFRAFMRILAKREAEGKNDKLPVARWYRRPVGASLPVKERRRYILSGLPYIGDKLAQNLLEHFSTISEIACASVDELEEVPKIGKKKAELIHRIFH